MTITSCHPTTGATAGFELGAKALSLVRPGGAFLLELAPQSIALALQLGHPSVRRAIRKPRLSLVLESEQLAFQLGQPRPPAAIRLFQIFRGLLEPRHFGRRGRCPGLRGGQRVLELGDERRLLGDRRLQLGELADVRRCRLMEALERPLPRFARGGQLL